MFEDSLVESTGRIRTRSSRFAIGSFFLQAAILAVLMLLPYLYPASLPRQALTMLLVAPPPPPAAAALAPKTQTQAGRTVPLLSLTMPSRIPAHAAIVADAAPSTLGPGLESTGPSTPGSLRDLFSMGTGLAPNVVAAAKPRSTPLPISRGVATGLLLAPIRPVYPAIAKAARIQGTVIVEATISKTGTVINAHAVSGPPMLIPAAIAAITQARYQPYKLNGEPVEVETTINVVFTLN